MVLQSKESLHPTQSLSRSLNLLTEALTAEPLDVTETLSSPSQCGLIGQLVSELLRLTHSPVKDVTLAAAR